MIKANNLQAVDESTIMVASARRDLFVSRASLKDVFDENILTLAAVLIRKRSMHWTQSLWKMAQFFIIGLTMLR